jgi:hypothetical protein
MRNHAEAAILCFIPPNQINKNMVNVLGRELFAESYTYKPDVSDEHFIKRAKEAFPHAELHTQHEIKRHIAILKKNPGRHDSRFRLDLATNATYSLLRAKKYGND